MSSLGRCKRHAGPACRTTVPRDSYLYAKPHLDDRMVGNSEEIGGPARSPVKKRERGKRDRIHGRFAVTANDRLMGEVIVLVIEIGIEAELVAVDQGERN